eukprot:TRINITY_DN8715_c0_g1_i1.p1 TRINITY_DN8715_c0_g1~~TRINITY_DN8715_c0_g1_i1.p1  ORF type:complete len:760 (-),score=100.95 TRINITY_DN8715_c0_g1_i1:329-2608(-)
MPQYLQTEAAADEVLERAGPPAAAENAGGQRTQAARAEVEDKPATDKSVADQSAYLNCAPEHGESAQLRGQAPSASVGEQLASSEVSTSRLSSELSEQSKSQVVPQGGSEQRSVDRENDDVASSCTPNDEKAPDAPGNGGYVVPAVPPSPELATFLSASRGASGENHRNDNEYEQKILDMLVGEASVFLRRSSLLAPRLAEIFDLLPAWGGCMQRARALLDAGLVFRQDGSAADLRSMVWEDVSEADRQRIMTRIRRAAQPPQPDHPGLVVLSDVDDTLLPATDRLHIGGCDRSWTLDGRLYPGVCRLHRELRRGLREQYGGQDYSVLLTARPPALVGGLKTTCRRLSGIRYPRLAILPGSGGAADMAMNAMRVLFSKFSQLGAVKVTRLQEYSDLFPEYVGRFVFIGDDGQGDLIAAEEMLGKAVPRPSWLPAVPASLSSARHSATIPLVAFVAVKACQNDDRLVVPPQQQGKTVKRIRKAHPALPPELTAVHSATDCQRHRFFYFQDYIDLAEQLAGAGWLEPKQRDAIVRAAGRDNIPEPLTLAESCDLVGMQASLDAKRAMACEAEADEAEMECLEAAQLLLPAVVATHLRLVPPPDAFETSALLLQILSVQMHGTSWQRENEADRSWMPNVSLQEVDHCGNVVPGTHWAFRTDGRLTLPWPCASLCRRHAGRCVLDVSIGGWRAGGRSYVILEQHMWDTDSDRGAKTEHPGTQGSIMLALVGQQGNRPQPSQPLGNLVVNVSWLRKPPDGYDFL